MANGIRFEHVRPSLTHAVLVSILAISIVPVSSGCRTPWRELSARSGDSGVKIKEYAPDSSDISDELSGVSQPRASFPKQKPLGGKVRKETLDRGVAYSLDDEEPKSTLMAEAMQFVPPDHQNLFRNQVQASLQARGKHSRSKASAATRRLSDAEDGAESLASAGNQSTADGSSFVADRNQTTTAAHNKSDQALPMAKILDKPLANTNATANEPIQIETVTSSRKSRDSSTAKSIQPQLKNTTKEPEANVRTASAESISIQADRQDVIPTEVVPATASAVPSESEAKDAATSSQLDWRGHLREALKNVDREREADSLSPEQRLHLDAVKRMIGLSLGDLDAAMQPIESVPPDMQDFFRYQFQAVNDAIDPSGNPVLSRRWTVALKNARQALSHLSAVSNLEILHTTFCSEVDSFGVMTKFPQYHFRPEQEVLLYCELDNFVAEPVKDGFETRLQGSYEIVDSTGRRVADQLLQLDEHVCRNRRRDYFIAYRIFMPRAIAQGRYQLKLTIEDMKGHKFGQSTIDFQIVQ